MIAEARRATQITKPETIQLRPVKGTRSVLDAEAFNHGANISCATTSTTTGTTTAAAAAATTNVITTASAALVIICIFRSIQ
jgi:hypothetical protein